MNPHAPLGHSDDNGLGQTQPPVAPPAYGQPPSQPVPPARQPIAPDTHYFHGFHHRDSGTYGASPKRRSGRRAVLLATLAAVLLAGGGGYAYVATRKTDPDSLFQQSLVNALSTKSFSQTISLDEGTATVKADVADVRRVSLSSRDESKSLGLDMSGYHTPSNGYVKIDKYPSLLDDTGTADAADFRGRWIQVRKDGQTEEEFRQSIGLFMTFTPTSVLAADYAIGNFAPADRQQLIGLIRSENIYTYDRQKVTEATVDGQAALRYDVKVRAAGLKKLEERVLQVAGATPDEQDLSSLLGLDEQDSTAVMYVALKSKRLVKVEAERAGLTSVVTYSGFDSTTLEAEPKVEVTWDAFSQANRSAIDSLGSIFGGLPDAPEGPDDERMVDINALQSHIEAYYANKGYYPTLAEVNNDAWRAENMKGLDPEALQDPDGTAARLSGAPAAAAYAYQVGTGDVLASCQAQPTECSDYVLTATLADGKVYSKRSF